MIESGSFEITKCKGEEQLRCHKTMVYKRVVNALLLVGTVVAGLVAATIFDAICLRSGMALGHLLLVSNIAIACSVGAVAIDVHCRRQRRLQELEERLKTISDINHEIRTVLGIVAFYGTQTASEHAITVFDEGFKRMEVLVRSVLAKWSLLDSSSDAQSVPFLHGALKNKMREIFTKCAGVRPVGRLTLLRGR